MNQQVLTVQDVITALSKIEDKSRPISIEVFREAEGYLEEENVELKKRYQDLFVQFNQLIGRHEWHNLEENPNDLPNNDCAEVLVKYRMSTSNPIPDDDCEYTVGFYDTDNRWVLKCFSWDRLDMYGHEILAWKEIE